jgi:hypothetical protein
VLPDDERAAVERRPVQIDLVEGPLKVIEAEIAKEAMPDPVVRRLMTLPGVDRTVASDVAAAISGLSGIPCGGVDEHFQAMARVKRSPKRTASAFAIGLEPMAPQWLPAHEARRVAIGAAGPERCRLPFLAGGVP